MRNAQTPVTENFISVRQPGMKGLNTIVDQHDILDQESPDMSNVWFDAGVIGPRTGSKIFAAKPTGETGTALQMMVGKTSDGVQYLVAVYAQSGSGYNLYVWDTTNNQWIPINGTYGPTYTKNVRLGYIGWCNGYGDDRLYFCNGYDDQASWKMAIGYLSATAGNTDTTITLSDATRFNIYSSSISGLSGNNLTLGTSPQANAMYTNEWELGQMVYYTGSGISGLTSGTVYYAIPTGYSLPTNGVSGNTLALATSLANAVAGTAISISGSPSSAYVYKVYPLNIYDGTTSHIVRYYNKSSNTLNLISAVGTSIGSGAAVTGTITDRPGVKKGKLMVNWQARLAVANFSPGGENVLWLSRISEPEDFNTVTDDISSGGNQIFQDGFGGITDIQNFGDFLVVSKQDISYRFGFIQDANLSAQFPQVTPIISGQGMGPIAPYSAVKALNSIYYPSTISGFMVLSPVSSGATSSTGVQVLSFNINNYIQNNLDLSSAKVCFFRNKIFWTASVKNGANIVMMYDTVRNAWTKFDSWNPADMAVYNNLFYYFSSIDGNVYQGLTTYTDNNNPYLSYFYTKMNGLNQPALPKTADAYYVEGYMTQSTTFYVDVLFNEKGELYYETFKLSPTTAGFFFTNINITALGQTPFNQSIMDSLTPSQVGQIGFFRGYLSLPNSKGFYAIQLRFYSKDPNSVWFVSGHGIAPEYQNIIPPGMRIDNTATSTTQPIIYSGSAVSIAQSQVGGLPWYTEVPSGTQDGANKVFTLVHTPLAVVFLTVNGVAQIQGVEYTLSGSTITFNIAPLVSDELSCSYQ